MSLDKSIANGKEHRKPYRKAKAADRTCRNHGTCPHCRNNRLYSARKTLLKIAERGDENEWSRTANWHCRKRRYKGEFPQ